MAKRFIVVVYDISDDRRRTKLHDLLVQYGTPVQYSVFECLLNEKRLAKIKRDVAKVIKPKVDKVRYYFLCQACVKRIEHTVADEGRDAEALDAVEAIVL